MAVNKVVLGDQTLIDLTNDTAEADDVAEGAYFHTAAGVRTVGTRRNIDVDDELSPTSENPVQNKVIYEALQNIHIDVDDELSATSENPVQNKVVTLALDQKADAYGRTKSGDIVSFYASEHANKNLLGLTVDIQPNQDLHGYDKPWPGGGGKNKLPIPASPVTQGTIICTPNADGSITISGTANTGATYFDLFAGNFDSTAFAGYVLSIDPEFSGTSSTVQIRISSSDRADTKQTVNTSATIVDNGSGLYLSIRVAGSYAPPSGGLTLRPMIRAANEADVWQPYENLCPISGWDSVRIERTGKNLIDTSAYWTDGTTSGVTYTRNADGSIYVQGTSTGGSTYRNIYPVAEKWILPVGEYIASGGTANVQLRINTYKADGTLISRVTVNDTPKTVTVTEDTGYIVVVVGYVASGTTVDETIYPQLEHASTESAYAPFDGNTYTITLGQTVYGGTLDAVNGTLTIDRRKIKISDINWTNPYTPSQAGYGCFRSGTVPGILEKCDPLSSAYATKVWGETIADLPDCHIQTGASGNTVVLLFVRHNAYAGNLNGWLADYGDEEIVYPLANPTTIQLDPVTISTITGQTNNIWADAGTVDVTYAVDIEAETQSKLNRKAGMLVDSVSGAIASFTPDATIPDLLGVSIDVEPVQDLHGYDAPWPAGGSNNKYNEATRASGMLNVITGEVTFDGTWSVSDFIDATAGDVTLSWDSDSRPYRANYCVYDASKTFISGTSYAGGIEYSHTFALPAGTAFVRFSWSVAVDGVVVQKTNVRVNFGSADLGYLPYENLCPISGWNAVEVETFGANIWDEQWVTGSIGTDGADIASSNGIRSANYCRCAGDTEYSFVQPAGITARVYWYGKTKNFISRSSAPREGSQAVITSPANAYWYRIQVGDATYRYPTYNNDIALLYPATETEYRTHVGTTYTIQLGQTVYGATLDATSGTLTITTAYGKLSDFPGWAYNATYRYFYSTNSVRESQFFVNACDAYQVVDWTIPAADRPDFSINTGASGIAQRKLYCRDSAITSVEDFLSSRGDVEIVYTLSTPITITLDPATIATISGQTNNVWADAGDVDVEYAADIKAYIDRLNQPTEDDMIANSLIEANKYFTINNRLFLSTASIAAGAQIIPGTNCTETSLAEALNALNA